MEVKIIVILQRWSKIGREAAVGDLLHSWGQDCKTGFGEVEGEVKICMCLPASKASVLRTVNFYIILKYV